MMEFTVVIIKRGTNDIFDRRQDVSWDEKIYSRTVEYEGYKYH